MRIFRDMELVEQLGSGIPRILKSYGKENFYFSDNYVRMIFPSLEKVKSGNRQNVVENVVESVVENETKILSLLKANNTLSAKELSIKLGLTERTVQRYLRQLTARNLLKRIGPDKGGHWKIIS